MRIPRLIVRFVCVAVINTLSATLVILANHSFFVPAATRHRWVDGIYTRWGGTLCRAFGARITVQGDIPRPPYVLVSNHLSYVDIFLLASLTPGIFVAKSEIIRWPVFGWLAGRVPTVFIDRRRIRDIPRVLELIQEVLDANRGVIFFPEGTSTGGDRLLPFRSPLLEIPCRLGLPVHYATISYSTPPGFPPASDAVCWWADMTLLNHLVRLLQLPYFEATIRFGPEPVTDTDRKRLAEQLWSRVHGQLTADGGANVAAAGVNDSAQDPLAEQKRLTQTSTPGEKERYPATSDASPGAERRGSAAGDAPVSERRMDARSHRAH